MRYDNNANLFQNGVNITNNNYYSVTVINTTALVTSDDYFSSDIVLGQASDSSAINVPMLSTVPVNLQTNLTIGKRSVAL